jgi:hypothetical protein
VSVTSTEVLSHCGSKLKLTSVVDVIEVVIGKAPITDSHRALRAR